MLQHSSAQTLRQFTCEWMCLSLMCAASCVVVVVAVAVVVGAVCRADEHYE